MGFVLHLMHTSHTSPSCSIVLQEALQQMRAVDDRIIYKLNTSVPTISFADQVSASDECKHLYEQVCQLSSSSNETGLYTTSTSIPEVRQITGWVFP